MVNTEWKSQFWKNFGLGMWSYAIMRLLQLEIIFSYFYRHFNILIKLWRAVLLSCQWDGDKKALLVFWCSFLVNFWVFNCVYAYKFLIGKFSIVLNLKKTIKEIIFLGLDLRILRRKHYSLKKLLRNLAIYPLLLSAFMELGPQNFSTSRCSAFLAVLLQS